MLSRAIDRRQSCGKRQSINASPLREDKWVGADIDCLRGTSECREGRCNILGPPHLEHRNIDAENASRCLNLVDLRDGGGVADIGQDAQTMDTRDDFTQEFKPFGSEVSRLERQTRDVAAWSREA